MSQLSDPRDVRPSFESSSEGSLRCRSTAAVMCSRGRGGYGAGALGSLWGVGGERVVQLEVLADGLTRLSTMRGGGLEALSRDAGRRDLDGGLAVAGLRVRVRERPGLPSKCRSTTVTSHEGTAISATTRSARAWAYGVGSFQLASGRKATSTTSSSNMTNRCVRISPASRVIRPAISPFRGRSAEVRRDRSFRGRARSCQSQRQIRNPPGRPRPPTGWPGAARRPASVGNHQMRSLSPAKAFGSAVH